MVRPGESPTQLQGEFVAKVQCLPGGAVVEFDLQEVLVRFHELDGRRNVEVDPSRRVDRAPGHGCSAQPMIDVGRIPRRRDGKQHRGLEGQLTGEVDRHARGQVGRSIG